MSIKKRLNKKLIILALLLVLIIGIGAVSAADNNTDEKLTASNDDVELSVTDNVKVSSSNESTLKASVDFSGTTFTELETAINGAASGDTIVLSKDIRNDRSNYVLIDKTITIDGNGHKIDAQGKSGIFFIKGSNVVLNNITFINARNSFPGGDNMYGGAIGWSGSDGVVNNSVFINNTAESGYIESGHGGAIDWVLADGGKIYNSKFYNNHANLTGGAIRVKSSMIIENSEFFYNEAQDGGAIHVVDQGATAGRMANCNFTANSAEDKGGAVYFYSNAMEVVDNYFTLNSARLGGAGFAYSNNDLFLDYQTVISNFAEYGGGFYLNTYAYCPVKVRWSEFLNNTAYKLGAGVYYYDLNNNVGYSDVDALNSDQNTMRETVDGDKGYLNWVISGWQNPVIETYFGGSRDNYLGVTATPENTNVAIDVSIPKDADKATAEIVLVIKNESGSEKSYTYNPSDSRWNYDDVNHSAMTVVTLYLTNQAVGKYNVTATFKDDRYYRTQRQGNTTYTIEGSKIKGNFTMLQELIDEAITSGTYVVDLDRDYTYSIGLDHGQMNIYDNLTINGNGHFLDALGYCRIFSITGDDVVLNNIIFTNGNASGVDGTLADYKNGGAILWSDGDNATVNNCTFTNNYATDGGALLGTSIGNVYINDTIFTQNTASDYGGAAHLKDNDNVIISNSTFKYCWAYIGSALYCNGDNNNISSCDFINNTARNSGVIEWIGNHGNLYGSNFINNKASSNAAITLRGDECIISHCSFDSNNASGYTGAILVDGIDATIANCDFRNNSASLNGGCILSQKANTHIYNSTFISNVAKSGGAIYFNQPNLIVYNSTFESNRAFWVGGAIASADKKNDDAKNANISNCTFKSNNVIFSSGWGGAICYINNKHNMDNLTVSDCIFESNSVCAVPFSDGSYADIENYGGAIYFEGDIFKIDNCNFTLNCLTATYKADCISSGGAVSAYGSNGIISNSHFESNSALEDGGAIDTDMNDLNIFNCGFEYNWAVNGGALNIFADDVILSNSTFEFNNASLGSAIQWFGDGGIVSNSTFLDNKADSVSLLRNNNDLTLTITLVGNDNYINAIYSYGDLTFNNVTYYNGQTVNSDDVAPVKSQNEAGQNIVLEFDNGHTKTTVTGETDVNGQFIYDYSDNLDCGIYSYDVSHPENTYYTAINAKDTLRFGEFDLLQHHVNKASDDSVLTLMRNYTYTIGVDTITNGVVINKKNLTINGNNHTVNALYKSRIFYVTSDDVVLNNITYVKGSAANGGAIYVDASATNLIISNTTFEKNQANAYGGAVLWNSSSGNINHAIFNDNHVVGPRTNGGAVYWNSTYCTISYTNFTDNSAENQGGALYSNADTTELDYVNFTDNQARNNGGAAWIKSDSTITNSNFINNHAANGGAIWIDSGATKLEHVNFTSNHAEGDGGAIAIMGSSAEISHANFNGDYAGDEGGAIYVTTPNSRIDDSAFEGTHAKNGGALYWDGLTGTVNNVTFIGTYSSQNGGAVYWNANDGTMTLANFTGTHADANGGAVYWIGSDGKVNDANFTNTYALSGGAIYWIGNEGAVSKSRFNTTRSTSAATSEGGGAIYWKSSNGNITESDFTKTSSNSNGGAILCDANAQTLANISIDNSKAVNNGGAIYLANGAANANLTNIDVFNTTASNGGGLYVNAIDVEFSNSNITNSSANNGGAIYWFGSGGNIYEIILSNNTAGDGGALYAESKSGDTKSTTFADITFDKNDATGYGGAICFDGDAGGYAVYNSTFTDNTAGQKGNSIYYYSGSSDNLNNSIYNSNFTGTNHIYIENSMRASLVNNTELNTRNGDYFVYNKGTIALSNNSLKNLIVNYGNILTLVTVTVCDNKTYTHDDFYFPLNATAVDDNGNTVVSDSLVFTTNHNDNLDSEIENDMHVATLVTNKDYYEVNITDTGLKKVNVKIAIINVIGKLGSYTWLQKEIDNFNGDVYVLTTNVTFNPDYDLSIYNIYYGKINFIDGMNFNKTIRFEGSNFTISGLNQARIFTVTANDIVINNTNFINGSTSEKGGALYITSNNAKIANSTFANNAAGTGGAISSVSNSGLTLGNLTFVNNTASNIAAVELYAVSDAQIKDLNFINNTATNDCGALSFIASGNVQTLNDCNFINNTAGNSYGAVYISNVNVDSCNFVNNTAEDYSALYMANGNNALTLTKSNFTGNLANNKATAGIANPNAKVSYCNFTDNEVKASGSALYVAARGVVISNNTFDKNVAGTDGTVYFASDSGKIVDSNFTNNKALNGAGVYTGTNEGIVIVNSSFISNIASLDAGAIYLAGQAGKIQYCNFTDNKAVNGGAVVLAGSNQEIGYCKFEGNNATYKGGSVYVKDGLSNTIHDTTFKKSYAFDGGAVYNSGSTGASLWLTNNTFIKNIASHNGGAVYYVVDADGDNPVIYRDYLNFTSDGITSEGVVDAQTGRTTLTMKSGGSTYQRIINCLFQDNEDYILNISATKDDLDTIVIVSIRNPKDGDKKSIRIVITVNSTDGSYKKQIIINETNYDYYFNTYLRSFVVNFRNVTQDMDYNVTVSFEDAVYLYKLNSTSLHVGHGKQIGDFKYLQQLIDNATSKATPGTIPVLDLPRNIIFTIGKEIWCDDSCVNITSPIIINGLGYTIDALGQSRIFNITSANVTLNNIKFVNGNSSGKYGDGVDRGGAIFWSGENGTLNNCEFRDNNAAIGGAIYYNSTASHGKISGSYFFNNTAVTNGGAIDCNASEMNLTNTLFESNYAGEYGAALCRETNATGGFGRDNNFTANNAGIAGAALAWMGVNNITINNYIFIDNTAGENGGAIYVDVNSNNCSVINSIFEGNNVTSMTGGNGGAIDWLGANATVLNSSFTNNNAYDGGAIYVGSTTGYTNITGSTFTKNGAINNGGAINLVASSVTVNESNFYDNSAINGGAIYVGGEGTTNFIYSSEFINNTATTGRGGAIDWVAAKGEIIDSNFTENSAEYGGGVYFGLKSKNSQIKNVIFTGNSATKNGGAIDWNSTDGELYNTQFISNYAGEYGAALCREANATGGHGNNNSFTSNHAGIAGAALAWIDSVGITITNYTFISNIADKKGGAIYINLNSHNCSIIECKFDSNEVTDLNDGHGGAIDCEASNATITNSSFTKNFAFEGGAIHVDSNSGNTNITNSNFTSNRAIGAGGAINLEASSVTVNGSNFIKNIASDGGAIYVGGKGLTNYVYNSNFEFNDAGNGHGGAIGWLSSTGHIINSNFTANSAEYGGGVYLNGNSTESQIIGSRFISNTANTNGGAIDWNATSGVLENNYFYKNYAGEYGAALCREANATGGHGYNNTFENNYAEIAGAGIAWMNVGNIKIDTYRFYNNMAGVGGAAIYIGYGSDNSTILNCDFKGNNITNDTGGHGGAIYCVAENATINNTNFTNNHAFYGGAIFVGTGSGHTNITNTNFINNGANVDGGALYLRSSSVLNNTIFKGNVAGEDGGAIYVDGISQDNYVYSSSFEDNHANSGLGGAINWGSSAGHIVDSNFTLNTADYGGGIYLGGNSDNSKITNVIFANNTATHNGGAIDWNATGGNLTNTTFKYNRAEYGAALCREAHATGGFGYNNTFISNHATKSGAALAWMGVNDIAIRKYTFINNTADFSGGAIYVSQFSDNCRVINSTFVDNYVSNAVAGRGGAIDWLGNNGTVINTTFERCISVNGGGIYVGDASNNMTIFNTSFTSCESLTNGGAIVIYGDDASITYSNFTSSVALDNGGAIAGFGSDNTVIANCVLKYNIAAGHIDPQGRPYGEGGAIYWENSNNLKIADSIFEANDAHLSGGDISANNCDNSLIYNINTYNATASTNGGSVAWKNSRNLNIDKSYFNDSGAGYCGGSIYLSNIDATIKNSVINSSWASWDIGGGIYVDGDVKIDNVYFNDTHSMYDNATAIYFKSGTSTVSNSNFTYSINSIGISKGARVTLSKNNISSEKPTKNTFYLLDGKYENVDYAVWNEGDLWLDKNVFDTVIFNNGTIWSHTVIKMLNNSTYNVTWNDNFTFWAKITDDNNNTIISVRSLNTSNDVYTDYRNHYELPYNAKTLQCAYQGLFHLTAIDPGLKDSEVHDGTLYVKMPVSVSLSLDQSRDDRIIITATLTPEAESNYTADGSIIIFKLGDKEFKVPVMNCPNIWTQHVQTYTLYDVPSGNYTLTATYGGNDYHLKGVGDTPLNVALREAWIKVVVENINYGQNATVVITTNSNGTVRFNLHGRDEVIEVPIVNGRGEFNLTLDNYTTTGKHSVGVVLEPNEYYGFAVNQTSFTVSKQNTGISATPTTPIFVGNPETIAVKVNENATGFVKITIKGKKYYEEVNKGLAIFEIYNIPYGRYNDIDVEYMGDDYFNETSTKVSFEVIRKNDYMINLRVNNITYGENVTIYASLPTDVGNDIVFAVNGTPYTGIKVLNGVAELTIPGLDVGEYPVVATYNGDNKYEYKFNQTAFTVKPTDEWILNITVEAHTYGQNTIFNVTLPQNVTKDVNLTIEGVNYTVKLINGTGNLTLNNISGGLHNVVASYPGDDRYVAKTNSTLFYIERAQSTVDLTQNGRSITATVTENATGYVKFVVNGKEQRIKIENNKATWTDVLFPGNNTVVAIYEGDKNFTDSNKAQNFTVDKYESYVNVTVENTPYKGIVEVTVKTPTDQTGYVTINVNNQNYTEKLEKGVAKFNITGLNVKKYDVDVAYLGDEKYNVSKNSTSFYVTSIDLNPTVIGVNVTKNMNSTFIVIVPEDYDGFVDITVDGNKYSGKVDAIIRMAKLQPGNKKADVKFYGATNYKDASLKVDFKVSNLNNTVFITEVVNNSTVVVTLPENATGNITVVFENGSSTVVNITNGTAVISLENLTPGQQNITVIYSGDENYTGISINTTVTIPKHDTELKVTVTDITDYGTAVVHVKVPANATGEIAVTIDGTTYYGPIDKDEAVIPVGNLTSGTKTVIAEYGGDNNYSAGYGVGKFDINVKANSTPTVIDYGNGTVVVVVGDNATGNVTIKVGDKEFNATVINGTAVVTVENVTPGVHDVEVIYSGDGNHTNSTISTDITAPKYDASVNVTVGEAKEGEPIVITVEVPKDATGNVTFIVGGKEYNATVEGGVAKVTVENLTYGDHTIVVEYSGDGNYSANYAVANVTVEKAKSDSAPVIVDYGNGTVVVVVGDNATGNVTVKVGDDVYNATVINGTAVVNVENVTPGKHDVEVIYSGDDNHKGATEDTQITVSASVTPIKVTTHNIGVGDKAIITVEVPKGATGIVTIEIDGVNYTSVIKEGMARFEVENLTSGNKSVFAVYEGDGIYARNFTSAKFNVSKVNSNLIVEITDAKVGENITVTVKVPTDATGQVLIDIGGVGYYLNVTDGIGTVEIPRLGEGNYDVVLTYTGDDKYLSSSNKTTVKVSKLQSFVIPMAYNICVGENENIRLIVPDDATGNVTVVINGEEFNFNLNNGALGAVYVEGEKYTVAVSGGKGELVISGLPKGKYLVNVRYNGNYKYLPSQNTTIFTVSKQNTQMDVIDQGNGTIKVVLPSDATGNVTVSDGKNTYVAEVVDGTAVITLNDTTPGKHDVIVEYSGNKDYSSNTTVVSVDVPKYSSPISVNVDNIKVGETEIVTVTLPKEATGIVTIEINGKKYSTNVENGKAIFKVAGLAFGDKTVAVMYSGDDYYRDNYTTAQFTVSKVDSTVKASGKDINVGKDEIITAIVPKDATGRVLVNIGGVGYYGKIINGKAKIIIPELPSGKYTVKVAYEGDDKYLPSTTQVKFTVSKVNAPISTGADNIDQGEDAIVVVKVPEDATGTITIKIDGKTYTQEVKEGIAVFVIPGLSKGDYNIVASYSGDRKYDANDTITDIEVYFNKTSEPEHPHYDSKNNGDGINLSQYPTANPLMLLLLMLLAAVGFCNVRKFRK